ncbi:hypothetical protein [Cesiribacter andamanensis]|uniref:Uncharacterized protein n=1 Tax=Cesiribacter andamanensis AMV16 TaxID=1279009 RepID=M7N720_9BACT|nr:hypothetical protein [Cesiribacter andamanensis]EMR03072.1 hypothetical protein ADICEAN_01801 [Cesiribacter andamanensis AMV16]
MTTKILMTLCALCLMAGGVLLSFLPDEVLAVAGLETAPPYPLLLQLLGALYFGFGMLNWMSKGGRIGGIYNRPIAVANFSHFMIGALALVKVLWAGTSAHPLFWGLTGLYGLFALSYGVLLFRHPLPAQQDAVRA